MIGRTNRIQLWLVSSALWLVSGCPSVPHVPVRPQWTPQPGDCLLLPTEPTHAVADSLCPPISATQEAHEHEPNGTIFTAVQLTSAACGGVELDGTLGSFDDIDFYQFPSCTLPFLSSIDLLDRSTQVPTVTFQGDSGSEVCLFASCSYGSTTLLGCSGSPDASVDAGTPSPVHLREGMHGCCRAGPGTLAAAVSCDSLTPQVNGYIMVESVDNTQCHDPYKVTFSIGTL